MEHLSNQCFPHFSLSPNNDSNTYRVLLTSRSLAPAHPAPLLTLGFPPQVKEHAPNPYTPALPLHLVGCGEALHSKW